MKKKSFTTRALHVEFPKNDPHRALHFPISESVAFDFDTGMFDARFRSEAKNPKNFGVRCKEINRMN